MSERARRIATSTLAIVAALALLGSLIGGYAWRAVFNSDQFAQRATAALDNQAVRDEAARRITNQLVARDADLIAVRPVLESVIAGIAGSGAFQDLFQTGVADLHRAVFTRDASTVTLTLADIGATIRGALEALQPKLAKKIPPETETSLLSTDPPDALLDVVQFADDVQWVPVALLLVGLGCAFASLRLAPDRRRAGLGLGIAISLAPVLALVAMQAIRAALLTGIDDQGARDAASAIWDAYLDDLRTALLLLAGCGAVLAAAASSLLRPVDVATQFRRASAFVTRVPERPGWRVARALLLIVAGVLIVVDAREFVVLVITLAGLYVAYAGVAELLRLTISEDAHAAEERRRGGAALIATGAAAGVILGAAVLFIGVGGLSERSNAIETEGCNGSNALCDRTLDRVAFPATHNAMSAASNRGWLFAQQGRGFADQLRDGIRGLLIDAHYGVETQDGTIKTELSDLSSAEREKYVEELGPEALDAALRIRDRIVDSPETGDRQVYLCHRFCELGAMPITKAFGEYRDFLAANADEVLVIVIEDYVAPEDIAKAFRDTGLDAYVYDGPVDPLPTLQQMIDTGGRVMMLAENEGGGTEYPWYHVAYDELLQETPYSFKRPELLTKPKYLPASCRANRGPRSAPLFLINHWVDTSPAPKASNADIVNAREVLLDRIHRCQRIRDLLANLIAVDFYERGDLFEVVDELNSERGAATAQSVSSGG